MLKKKILNSPLRARTQIPKFSHRPLISCFGKSVDKDDHTDLFWFKEGGEGFLREIIRMNLLMMAVFVAYCVTIFVPNTLYGSHHDDVKESMQIFSIVMLVRDVVYFNHITFFMFQLRHSNLTIDILLSNIIREHSIDIYILSNFRESIL